MTLYNNSVRLLFLTSVPSWFGMLVVGNAMVHKAGGLWEFSVLCIQFCCNSKNIKFIKKHINIDIISVTIKMLIFIAMKESKTD